MRHLLFLLLPTFCFAAPVPDKSPPQFNSPTTLSLNLHGHVRNYIDAVTQNWLLRAPIDNPAMLDMFRDRDKQLQLVQVHGLLFIAIRYDKRKKLVLDTMDGAVP